MLSISKPDHLPLKLAHITFCNHEFLDVWMDAGGVLFRTRSLYYQRDYDWFLQKDGNIFDSLSILLQKPRDHLVMNNLFLIGDTVVKIGPISTMNWSNLITGHVLHGNVWDSYEMRSDCEIQALQLELAYPEPVDLLKAKNAASLAFHALCAEELASCRCKECVPDHLHANNYPLEEIVRWILYAACGCKGGSSAFVIQNGFILCKLCKEEIEDNYSRCSCMQPTVTRVMCGSDLIVHGQCYACGLRMSKEKRLAALGEIV